MIHRLDIPPAMRAAVLLVTLLAIPATARTEPAPLPLEHLKSVYLECERAAGAGSLASGDIGRCSIVYQELKRRAFHGDYGSLKRWYDSQRLSGLSG